MVEPRVVPVPPLTGSPGLAQGSYGDRGNLELIAPDAHDGCWVFWFNGDLVDHRSGARPGRWSGGLHVFAGHRAVAARITQVRRGPDFLEALVLADTGDLHRLYWTPADGFVGGGVVARAAVDCSAVVEHDTSLRIEVLLRDGTARRLTGAVDAYPSVTWTAERVDPPARRWSVHDAATGVGLDDAGRVVDSAGRIVAAETAHAVAAARTTLDGGRVDVVAAVGTGLVHVIGSADHWTHPEPVVSDVWVAPGAAVHRRG